VDFIAPDEKIFDLWTDGINALLGNKKTITSMKVRIPNYASYWIIYREGDGEQRGKIRLGHSASHGNQVEASGYRRSHDPTRTATNSPTSTEL